jgi:(1->4)-alpha-D-glucan 1-alpha-D-glucosylmutase
VSRREALLARLAELWGIEPSYVDILGQRHDTTPAARHALLEAMGVALADGDEAALAAAVHQREQMPWRRLLPPVVVRRARHEGVDVELAVPDALLAEEGRLVVHREDGSVLDDVLTPAALPRAGEATVDGTAVSRCRLRLPPLPEGYHRLEVALGERSAACPLIVTPQRCYLPALLDSGGRAWGPTLQLYAVRSSRNWGIGDFTDLRAALTVAAGAGAGTLGLNPLHALYPHEPEQASPYTPSSRLYWNVLYLDVAACPGLERCPEAQARLEDPAWRARLTAARDADVVDYAEVAALKRAVLEPLFEHFLRHELTPGTELGSEFRRHRAAAGPSLRRHALYEMLAEHFRREDPRAWGWPVWPAGHEHPDAPAVAELAARHADRVTFFEWLQWLAERQLAAAGGHAMSLGLGVGLYLDLPLGADAGGSEVWAGGSLFARRASVGAPPDDFNARGQNWGLPPWNPEELAARGYAPFIELLRRNMAVAGVLRIDHVMSLMRLFWIPAGAPASEGAYVRYPLHDLLGILALESQRNRCAVIGEDLGTVPDELRAALAALGVLSTRIFYFERDPDDEFLPPAALPRQALVAVSNHDLPPLASFWLGEDIALRQRLGLFADDAEREAQVVRRAVDRTRLLEALRRQGLLPSDLHLDPAAGAPLPHALAVAVHRYVARSPAMVLGLQMEDALGSVIQMNVPGTWVEHPNWRHKLPLELERWAEDPRVSGLFEAVVRERGRGVSDTGGNGS